jgi:RHS repeat-associated protein
MSPPGPAHRRAHRPDPVLGRRWTSLRYKAWGEQRYAEGVAPTDFRYTGQRFESLLGLHDYGARWYDDSLGRWLQPDSIVPLESQGVQAWDRFAYANNNPVRYNDPSGHDVGCAGRDASECRKTNTPSPRKPTPIPSLSQHSFQDKFIDRRTPTPHGPRLIPGPTSTATPPIPATPYQPKLQIDVQVDWSQVDWADVGIDVIGLAANGVNIGATFVGAPEIGLIADTVGGVVEVGGLIKAGIDMSQGDLHNLKLQLATDNTKQLALVMKAERAVPYVGFFGNAVSLWLNFKPTISVHFR